MVDVISGCGIARSAAPLVGTYTLFTTFPLACGYACWFAGPTEVTDGPAVAFPGIKASPNAAEDTGGVWPSWPVNIGLTEEKAPFIALNIDRVFGVAPSPKGARPSAVCPAFGGQGRTPPGGMWPGACSGATMGAAVAPKEPSSRIVELG